MSNRKWKPTQWQGPLGAAAFQLPRQTESHAESSEKRHLTECLSFTCAIGGKGEEAGGGKTGGGKEVMSETATQSGNQDSVEIEQDTW